MSTRKVRDADQAGAAEGICRITSHAMALTGHPATPGPPRPPKQGTRLVAGAPLSQPRPSLRYRAGR